MDKLVTTDNQQPDVARSLWNLGDENQRILNFAYFVLGIAVCYVLANFFQYALNLLLSQVLIDSSLALQLERSPIAPGYILGVLAGTVGMVVLRYHAIANQFGLEVVAELKKVTWPPMNVTWKSTIAVIVTVIFCSIFLGFFDFLWGALMAFLLS